MAQIAHVCTGVVEIALLHCAVIKAQFPRRFHQHVVRLSGNDRHIALKDLSLDLPAESVSRAVVSPVHLLTVLLYHLKGRRPDFCLHYGFVGHAVQHVSRLADHVMESHMILLAESLPHQSHHLNGAGGDA